MTSTMPDIDKMITLAEAHERFGISTSTLRYWAREGIMDPDAVRKVGKTWLVLPEAVVKAQAELKKLGTHRHTPRQYRTDE